MSDDPSVENTMLYTRGVNRQSCLTGFGDGVYDAEGDIDGDTVGVWLTVGEMVDVCDPVGDGMMVDVGVVLGKTECGGVRVGDMDGDGTMRVTEGVGVVVAEWVLLMVGVGVTVVVFVGDGVGVTVGDSVGADMEVEGEGVLLPVPLGA